MLKDTSALYSEVCGEHQTAFLQLWLSTDGADHGVQRPLCAGKHNSLTEDKEVKWN